MNASVIKHIVFIDDDAAEIGAFERLYSGDLFRVTAIQVQAPGSAAAAIEEALGGAAPDLFVLDMYFPGSDSPPDGLSEESIQVADGAIREITHAAEALKDDFADGKTLLRQTQALASRTRELLDRWCAELGQSPANGIELMRIVRRKYPGVPIIFYSRKATVEDVKAALRAGALDVMLKPVASEEEARAPDIMRQFERYCAGKPPEYLGRL